MASDEITIRVLQEIRDDLRALRVDTNRRFDETNGRLDQRIDETNERVERLTTTTKAGLAEVARAIKKSEYFTLTELRETEAKLEAARFRDREAARLRLEHCEQAIAEINQRLTHGGLG
jgi:hypothetical protein